MFNAKLNIIKYLIENNVTETPDLHKINADPQPRQKVIFFIVNLLKKFKCRFQHREDKQVLAYGTASVSKLSHLIELLEP